MFDTAKIVRIQAYIAESRGGYYISPANYEALELLEQAYRDAQGSNRQLEILRKEQNSFRRAARKAGDQARSLIQDCTLLFIIKDGWFPSTQRQAVDSAIRAAKNAFRAHPELREAL